MHPESLANMAGATGGRMMGTAKNGVRFRIFSGVAISAMAVMSPAQAQGGQQQNFDIHADDLGEALKSVSRQSGREIIFSAEATKGKAAPSLKGSYTPDDAVRALLAGSGLTAEFRKDVVLIRGRSETPGEIASGPASDTEILITGSRIRGAATPSPLIVSTRKQIEETGQSDLGGFARTLPQNFAGGQNPTVAGGGNQGASNQNTNASSTLNLRGLGPDATLTLINGHRVAYDGVFQGVDIAAIPLLALDRIELVADGSSAIYGSDAVGGVANLILRRDYDGAALSARLGASTDGGNEQQQYGAIAGKRWSTGGFMVAGDYSATTAINAGQRSYTQSQDPSQTLVPAQRQWSFVLTGHQSLSDALAFKLDAQLSTRTSENGFANLTTADIFTDGTWSQPKVTTYTITPSLTLALPSDWQASLLGSLGRSKTTILTTLYSAKAATQQINVLYDDDLAAAELNAEGPLFALPGGDLRLAAGAGYRSNGLDALIQATPTGGATTIRDTFSASRDVFYGFGEISLPLVGAQNAVPLVHSLQLSGAARYEGYRGGESVTTPRLGIVYAPIPDLRIKGSWGKSFKAQTLYQQYQLRGVSVLNGASITNFPAGRTYLYLNGGGPNLRPERATTWSASIDLTPKALPGFRAQIGYFNIHYTDRVDTPISSVGSVLLDPSSADLVILNPTLTQINDTVATASQGLRNFTGAPFNPAQVYAIINNRLQNTALQNAEGVDVVVDYHATLAADERLDLAASASYLRSDRQVAVSKPVVQLAGTNFDPPNWRMRVGGAYEKSNVLFSGFVSYIGSVIDNRREPNYRVGAFISVDASTRIRATGGPFRGLEFGVSVINLFNEKPAELKNSSQLDPTYDSTNYPAAGRVISLTVTKSW
jgi:outer membrane receptor protein involved in Fe transport